MPVPILLLAKKEKTKPNLYFCPTSYPYENL